MNRRTMDIVNLICRQSLLARFQKLNNDNQTPIGNQNIPLLLQTSLRFIIGRLIFTIFLDGILKTAASIQVFLIILCNMLTSEVALTLANEPRELSRFTNPPI